MYSSRAGAVSVTVVFFGDKIYHDESYFNHLAERQNAIMHTLVKGVNGQLECTKQFDWVANELYSKAVSKIWQPIQSAFSWLQVHTEIQRASLVRSTNG
jgi:hypothetical protein